jgi:TRAP-type C4-dicarboxylate transport system substrate-binding protein
MSTQLKLNIDLKELYKRLPPECQKVLLQYIKEKMDEAMLERMLLGEEEEQKTKQKVK